MKKILFYLVIFLFFVTNLFAQKEYLQKFRAFDFDARPIFKYDVYIDGIKNEDEIFDGFFNFYYGNETKKYKFEIVHPETKAKKRFEINVKDGKNDLPSKIIVFNQLSAFVTLENENYDIRNIFDVLDSCGATDLFVKTFYNGKTIYPSSIKEIGQHGSKDYLKEVIEEGKKRGVRIHAVINTLCWSDNQAHKLPKDFLMLNRNGRADEGSEKDIIFVTPSNPKVVKIITNLVEEICSRYPELYGINLDYIRFKTGLADNRNLNTFDFGYEKSTKDAFKKTNKIDPKAITFDTTENSDWLKWIIFKEDMITNFTVKLLTSIKSKKPNIITTASVNPNYIRQRGQNLECQYWPDLINFANIDYLLQGCSGDKDYAKEIKSIREYLNSSVVVISLSGQPANDPLEKQIEVLKVNYLITEFGISKFDDLKDKKNQKLLRNLIFKY